MEKMNAVDGKEGKIFSLMITLYDTIVREIENKKRKSKGLMVYVVYPDNPKEFLLEKLYKPTKQDKIQVVEQAVRANLNRDFSSMNTENVELLRFQGSLTTDILGYKIQVSVSGLLPEENSAISIILLSNITEKDVKEIANNIEKNHGEIPLFWEDAQSELYKLVQEFSFKG